VLEHTVRHTPVKLSQELHHLFRRQICRSGHEAHHVREECCGILPARGAERPVGASELVDEVRREVAGEVGSRSLRLGLLDDHLAHAPDHRR
jgi:hypothetical protein